MKNNIAIAGSLLVGLFGLFGIDADEQTVLALVTGLVMAGGAIYTIINNNRN